MLPPPSASVAVQTPSAPGSVLGPAPESPLGWSRQGRGRGRAPRSRHSKASRAPDTRGSAPREPTLLCRSFRLGDHLPSAWCSVIAELPAIAANSGDPLRHPVPAVGVSLDASPLRWLRAAVSSGCWAWLCVLWAAATARVPRTSFPSVAWEYTSVEICSERSWRCSGCLSCPDPVRHSPPPDSQRPRRFSCWTCITPWLMAMTTVGSRSPTWGAPTSS